jgi:hypothetical protein
MLVIEAMNRRVGRKARRDALLQAAGLGGLLLLLVAIPSIDIYRTWAAERAARRAWDIKGPPCPVVDHASRAVVGFKPTKNFNYNKVSFTRHLGHASCVAFREDGFFNTRFYSVCQFSGPGAVKVDAAGRTTTFQPGPGKRTTVTIRDGRASCVVGGWFRY